MHFNCYDCNDVVDFDAALLAHTSVFHSKKRIYLRIAENARSAFKVLRLTCTHRVGNFFVLKSLVPGIYW